MGDEGGQWVPGVGHESVQAESQRVPPELLPAAREAGFARMRGCPFPLHGLDETWPGGRRLGGDGEHDAGGVWRTHDLTADGRPTDVDAVALVSVDVESSIDGGRRFRGASAA